MYSVMMLPTKACGLLSLSFAAALAACGGGNPLDNPPGVVNTPGGGGQNLSFIYFQRCINPMLVAQLALPGGGVGSCASSGCHDSVRGTGGAFRMEANAADVDLAATAPDAARQTAMYRNFFSAQGSSVIGGPTSSKMLTKPLVLNVLHGGGQIFADANTPEARLLSYWIGRPMPQGQDEFSNAAASMFTPADPATGQCNTQ
jgi:predicted small lipoprotein YifL